MWRAALIFGIVAVHAPIAFAGAAHDTAGDQTMASARRIGAAAMIGGHALDDVTWLADRIGPRLTGSANLDTAQAWAADQLRAAGMDSVTVEDYPLPHGWVRGQSTGEIIAPVARELRLRSYAWSTSLPDTTAQLIVLADLAPETITRERANIAGRFVYVDGAKLFESDEGATQFENAPAQLLAAGARAFLVSAGGKNNALPTFALVLSDKVPPLPAMLVGTEDGALLRRLAEKDTLTLKLRNDSRITGPITAHNVVGELRGSDSGDGWIAVGAHIDSVDGGTGAQDNGAGTAMVLESARILGGMGQRPQRSIRFILFSGEEEGMLGSRAYAARHATELSHCTAMLNVDSGTGKATGWALPGREDAKPNLQRLSPMLAGLGADGIDTEMNSFAFFSDHGPFVFAGVPAMYMMNDLDDYWPIHHMAGDTLEKLDARELAIGTSVLGITAWSLANGPALGGQLDRAAMRHSIDKAKLGDMLKSMDWRLP